MRIISPFHDYYDIGMGLGHDEHTVYVRTPVEVEILRGRRKVRTDTPEEKVVKDLVAGLPQTSNFTSSSSAIVIGFCGKFYPSLVFYPINSGAKPVYCYSLEEVDKYMQGRRKPEQALYFNMRIYGYRYTIKRMFDRYAEVDMLEPFIANRSPVIVLKDNKAIWNARLRDYHFERVIDPYQAFQKIDMFLGNLATPEKPIPPRTDKQKVQSHGMDEWSFRKKSGDNK